MGVMELAIGLFALLVVTALIVRGSNAPPWAKTAATASLVGLVVIAFLVVLFINVMATG